MKLPVWAALAMSAAGCSLIIPLDYTGGVGGSSGSGGAGASHGGSSGAGNAPQGGTSQGAEAGVGNDGGNPQSGAGPEGGGGGTSPGGTDSGGNGGTDGGTSGNGGTSGGVGGSSMGGEDAGGEAGTGAAGTSGGVGGGGAGSGGRGGRGGGAGAGMAGMAGCSFDLTSNPMHCGSCTNACPNGNECIDSECVATPCDKLGCTTILMPINNGDGPRRENLGTGDVCVEVGNYTPNAGKLPGINCWNTGTGRIVEVNDVAVACGGDKLLNMPKRKGGYCFHAGPGDYASAGFVMPYSPSDDCCKAPTGGTGGIGGT